MTDATGNIIYDSSFGFAAPSTAPTYAPLNDTALVPIPALAQLPPATRTISLEVSFDTMSDGTNRGMFNNVTYNTPVVPPELSALTLDNVSAL